MQLLLFLTPTTGYFDLFTIYYFTLNTRYVTKHLIAGPLEYS